MNLRFSFLVLLMIAFTITTSAQDEVLEEDISAPPSSAGEAKAPEEELLDFENLQEAEGTKGPPAGQEQATTESEADLEKELSDAEPSPPPAEEPVAEPEPVPSPEQIAEPAPEPSAEPVTPPPAETAQEVPPPAPSAPGEPDPEDLRKERRFARIYDKFLKPQMSDEQWAGIVSSKGASESYAIQGGDTLWDVSSKLFGDGFYWPKVWQLNDKITNPHMIVAGNTLQFTPGGSAQPPSLDVNQTGAPTEAPPGPEIPQAEAAPEAPAEPAPEEVAEAAPPASSSEIVIPPAKQRRAVLKSIPASFPDWNRSTKGFDGDGFSLDVVSKVAGGSGFSNYLHSLISDEPWEGEGEIAEINEDQKVASTYQKIIVKLNGSANTGQTYLVYSNEEQVEDPISGDVAGYEVETRGQIRIEEPVESDSGDNLYRATVTKAVLPIRVGDPIKVGTLTHVESGPGGAMSNVGARLVGGELRQRRVGLYNLVFLNRGENDGLQVGQLLNVLKNQKLRNEESLLRVDSRPVAQIKVVNVGKNVATAYVISANDSVIIGDETGVVASRSSSPDSNVPSSESELMNEADSPGGDSGSESGGENPTDTDASAEQELLE